MNWAGYTLDEPPLHVGRRNLVYRGRQTATGRPVVLKTLKSNHPRREDEARLVHEYHLCRALDGAGVVDTLGLERDEGRIALVLEDFGGQAVSERLAERPFALDEFLTTAIRLAEILGHIHGAGIIHKDIKPANILIRDSDGVVKITDFGISSRLAREATEVSPPERLEGTLAYMSPEQTGRMHRAIDSRTDIYSLGVTLYEMLTGRPPYTGADPLALIHSHLARTPEPPGELRPGTPPMLERIIAKMMARKLEERYRTALGVARDLERCQDLLEVDNLYGTFELGQDDHLGQLRLPETLYGREWETDRLFAALEQAVAGTKSLVTVSGYSGIGKSRLVHELQKRIPGRRAQFIAGKYDQFKRDIPYQAVLQALDELLGQALSAEEERLHAWKIDVTERINPNGRVLTEVLPRLKLIIGDQPEVASLGPLEAQNRFEAVLLEFMRAVIPDEAPLVIFLDDLQWVDSPSLRFLRLVLNDAHIRNLLLIYAYRDNEVQVGHPLLDLIEETRTSDVPVTRLELENLSMEDVEAWVADTIQRSAAECRPLATIARKKTDGNPFFLGEFLGDIARRRLLYFSGAPAYRWEWNLEEIQQADITENVVDFLTQRLQHLEDATRDSLKLAAAIGAHFDLGTLTQIAGRPAREIQTALWAALQAGLLLPRDNSYRYLGEGFQDQEWPTDRIRFRFLHDRIQQAAYALLQDAERATVHYRIAGALLATTKESELDERVIEIVEHYNHATERIAEGAERVKIAGLNLRAARRAHASAAYGPSATFSLAGIALLPAEAWQAEYELATALHIAAVEALYITGRLTEADEFAATVLHHSRSPLDTATIYSLRIQLHTTRNENEAAVATALEILKDLGVTLPGNPNPLHVVYYLIRLKLALRGREVESLLDLPPMRDQAKAFALRVLAMAMAPAYTSNPNTMAIFVFTMVWLSIKYGNGKFSVSGYVYYGLALCGPLGDPRTGYRFGELSLKLLDKLHVPELLGPTNFSRNCMIRHWREHIGHTIDELKAADGQSFEAGELLFSAYNIFVWFQHSILKGESLAYMDGEYERVRARVEEELKQENSPQWVRIFGQFIYNLRHPREDPAHLNGPRFDEAAGATYLLDSKNYLGMAYMYIARLMLACIFGDFSGAYRIGLACRPYLGAITALYLVPIYHFFFALAAIRHAGSGGTWNRLSCMRRFRASYRQVRFAVRHGPANHKHRIELLDAEHARFKKDYKTTLDAYDRAIETARQSGFVQDEALAFELAARFMIENDKQRIARLFLENAYYLYSTWGALHKADLLKEENLRLPPALNTRREDTLTLDTRVISADYRQRLDLETLMKASRTIGESLVFDEFLTKFMRVVIENAAAERACLVTNEGEDFMVRARLTTPDGEVNRNPRPLRELRDALPTSVINFSRRTGESVILNNPAASPEFREDAYFRTRGEISVACIPLRKQGGIVAILCLENTQTSGLFTPEQKEFLEILSAQAAIALENARLYHEVETRVKDRTQKLHDLTQQLIETEKMAALGNLVAGVAHEINTPVGIGVTAASTLEMETQELLQHIEREELSSEINDYLVVAEDSSQLILKSLERAANLVQSFKQVAVDQSKDEWRNFNVIEYINEVLTSLGPLHSPHLVEVEGDTTLSMTSYPGPLSQLVTNLISNSSYHAYPDGSTGLIKISVESSTSDLVKIVYSDDGRGMHPNTLSKAFEPFFTTNRQQGGSGLGLNIVYNLVTGTLEGSLDLESEPGQGVKFTFLLPTVVKDARDRTFQGPELAYPE